MNDTQMLNWLEEQAEIMINKTDGNDYIVVTRQNGLLQTAEYPSLRAALIAIINDNP